MKPNERKKEENGKSKKEKGWMRERNLRGKKEENGKGKKENG